MWDRNKLESIAQQEADALSDQRWNRIYYAIERYEGFLQEVTNPDEAAQELDKALDAVSYEDIDRQLTGTPVDSFFDRMRFHKERRERERVQTPTAEPEQESDNEPKM